jgi:hypothetical protein
VELSAASPHPHTSEMLARLGGFLDAFAKGDIAFFERHLRADAALVFPEMSQPVDKAGCIASVSSHPPYTSHRILSEPILQPIGVTTTIITLLAEVGTAANDVARSTMITAIVDEGDPWQLVHLQWTPAAHTNKEGTQ